MDYREIISEIVDTYELPKKLRRRIIWISTRMAEERGIYSFDNLYRYISDLVEKFQFPFKEPKVLKTNQKTKDKTLFQLKTLWNT